MATKKPRRPKLPPNMKWTPSGRVEVRYYDTKGERRSKNYDTLPEAIEGKRLLDSETYIPTRESITLGEGFAKWLAVCTTGRAGRKKVRSNTLRHYKIEAGLIVGTIWDPKGREKLKESLVMPDGKRAADIKLTTIDSGVLMTISTALLATTTKDQARRAFDRFREMVNEMRVWKLIAHDPFDGVDRLDAEPPQKKDIPTADEVKIILQTLKELSESDERWERWRLMIETLFLSGTRSSEMRGLFRKHVDFEQGTIRVRQSADGHDINDTKTVAGMRDLRMPPEFMTRLAVYMAKTQGGPDTPVFATRNGTPVLYSHFLQHAWGELMEHAGMIDATTGKRKFSPHVLRHHYASMRIDRGRNPKQIQVAMGHAKIETTMNIYGHIFDRQKFTEQSAADAAWLEKTFMDGGAGPQPEPPKDDSGVVVGFVRKTA